MKALAILLLFFGSIYTLSGKTTLWVSTAGSWHDARNWSNGVPSTGDSAIINSRGADVSITTTAQAEHIFLGSGSVLTVQSNLSLENSIGDAMIAEGLVRVSGSISIINPGGEGLMVTDSLYNLGTIYVQDVHTFPKHGFSVDGGGLQNDGSIIVSNCRLGFYCSDGFLNNTNIGSITSINCRISFRSSTRASLNAGMFTTTAGNVDVIEDGDLDHLSGGKINIDGGRLRINKGSVLNSFGSISIEGDFGISISFSGHLNLKPGSTLSTAPGAQDRLDMFESGDLNVEEGAELILQ